MNFRLTALKPGYVELKRRSFEKNLSLILFLISLILVFSKFSTFLLWIFSAGDAYHRSDLILFLTGLACFSGSVMYRRFTKRQPSKIILDEEKAVMIFFDRKNHEQASIPFADLLDFIIESASPGFNTSISNRDLRNWRVHILTKDFSRITIDSVRSQKEAEKLVADLKASLDLKRRGPERNYNLPERFSHDTAGGKMTFKWRNFISIYGIHAIIILTIIILLVVQLEEIIPADKVYLIRIILGAVVLGGAGFFYNHLMSLMTNYSLEIQNDTVSLKTTRLGSEKITWSLSLKNLYLLRTDLDGGEWKGGVFFSDASEYKTLQKVWTDKPSILDLTDVFRTIKGNYPVEINDLTWIEKINLSQFLRKRIKEAGGVNLT